MSLKSFEQAQTNAFLETKQIPRAFKGYTELRASVDTWDSKMVKAMLPMMILLIVPPLTPLIPTCALPVIFFEEIYFQMWKLNPEHRQLIDDIKATL